MKVVFTNGCFDILHRGHVSYLNEAKSLGDKLIIGLNSDASVKRLKGDSRPINSESDRKFVLENLKAVDEVFIFEEDTPLELIKKIMPDVLVKGGDWSVDQIVGSKEVLQNGGEVKSLKFIEGKSTTGIIEKISSQ
jgi:rfaE bifunctional protein nucleotidyltransferase chain/domain